MQQRLGSAPLVHAPGVIKFAVTMFQTAQTTKEEETAVDILNSWPITADAVVLILEGKYTVEGNVVVVELDDEEK